MKFYGVRVYDMCESIIASGFPMLKREYTPEEFEWEVENLNGCFKDYKNYLFDLANKPKEIRETLPKDLQKACNHIRRACNLGGAIPGSGHDCMAKGIAVHVNIKADQSFWLQFERYHHQDTISSMSTMHCLCKFEKLNEMFSPYTDPRSIAICNEYIEIYNNDPTPENFQKVIHNCPEGIELTRRIETNYLQLKTMFSQRKNHKMFAWSKDFKKLIDSLPYFYEFTGIDKED